VGRVVRRFLSRFQRGVKGRMRRRFQRGMVGRDAESVCESVLQSAQWRALWSGYQLGL